MEELEARQDNFPELLNRYAEQGRYFLNAAAGSLVQFGRVLYEAKPFVPQGQFEKWVRESFGMSERTAQQYMQVWRRFGNSDELKNVRFSNLQKMLALPEGTEETFIQENDLESMTAREVEKAVKAEKAKQEAEKEAMRQEAKAEIDKAKAQARSAEETARRLAEQKSQVPAHIQDEMRKQERQIAEYREEIQKLASKAKDMDCAVQEINTLRRELADTEEALKENQQEYNRIQGELLDARSALAKGDAEREVTAEFTLTDFSAAVRGFLGSVAQVPAMGWLFSDPGCAAEVQQWKTLLQCVEDWTARARKAMETVGVTYDAG